MIFSNDGKKLVAMCTGGTARLLSGENGEQPPVILNSEDESGGTITSVAFTPQGDALVTGDAEGDVKSWSVAGGRPTLLYQNGVYINSMSFTPDGKMLAFGDEKGGVVVLAVGNRGVFKKLRGGEASKGANAPPATPRTPVKSVLFDPKGETLAVGNLHSVSRWSTRNWRARPELSDPQSKLAGSIAFTGDGSGIVALALDGRVLLWDIARDNEEENEGGNENNNSTNEDDNSIWNDISDNRIGARLYKAVSRTGSALALGPSGEMLASVTAEGSIVLWQVPRPLTRLKDGPRFGDHIKNVQFSPDGKTFAVAVSDVARGIVFLADFNSRTATCPQPLTLASDPVNMAFSHDGATLAVLMADGVLTLWDAKSCSEGRTFKSDLSWPGGDSDAKADFRSLLTYGPDGKVILLVDGPSQNELSLVELDTGSGHTQVLRKIPVREGSTPTSIALNHDRTLIAVGDDKGSIIIYHYSDLPKLSESYRPRSEDDPMKLPEIHGPRGEFADIVFSRDKTTLVSAINFPHVRVEDDEYQEGGSIILWDIKTGEPFSDKLASHDENISSLAFNHEGSMLWSSGSDGLLIPWEMIRWNAEDDLKAVRGRFCSIVNRNLTAKESTTLLYGREDKYCRICPDLPSGKGAPVDAPVCK
jgi:WD40 repeat protein